MTSSVHDDIQDGRLASSSVLKASSLNYRHEPALPEPPPLVIVEGFLGGFGRQTRWGDFQSHWHADSVAGSPTKQRRAIFVAVGPVSSLHDRACEIFYSLKGGTLDYGKEHASEHGHATRYGRTYAAGLYPEWSNQNPLHFLGHSFGGPTITKLQWLLKTGFFGAEYGPDMLLSVNTVSSPFRGTSIVYLLGERVESAPNVRFWSVGSLITKIVHIVSYFRPWTAEYMDFHTETRGFSYQEMSLFSLIRQLWRSDWGESRDIAPFDCTYESMDGREANGEGAVHPKTYYRSYAASWSKMKNGNFAPPQQDFWQEPALYYYSPYVASFDFTVLRPVPSFIQEEDPTLYGEGSDVYRENDGVVPLFSQWHPLLCQKTACEHFKHGDITKTPAEDEDSDEVPALPIAGKWHVFELQQAHHGTIAPTWLDTPRQRGFWKELGQWLRAVDAAAASSRGPT